MSTGAGDSPGRPAPEEVQLPASEHGLARSLFSDPRFGPLPVLLVTLTVVTTAEVLLAAVALLIAALSGDPGVSHGTLHLGAAGAFSSAVTDVLACLLAGALGIQDAVALRLAVPDMTTTVLTMTLTGLGADLQAVRHGTGPGSGGVVRTAARAALGRRLLVVAAMVAGKS